MWEPFRRALNDRCGLTEKDFVEKITIDVPMPLAYIRKDLVRELKILEPFGKGNEKPLFCPEGTASQSFAGAGKKPECGADAADR